MEDLLCSIVVATFLQYSLCRLGDLFISASYVEDDNH